MTPAPLDAWRPVLKGRRFLWLLAPPWHDVPTRQNHFARRLARLGAEILYVENPPALSSVIRQRRWRELRLRRLGPIREIEPRLHVLSPGLNFPGMKRSDTVASVNGRLIAGQINRYLQQQGWSSYECWCRVPASIFALRYLTPDTTVYDITDDYGLYERNGAARATVREREGLLLARADHVFITSAELRKNPVISALRPRLVPNGVDYELFAQGGEAGPVHPVIASIQKPIIGYVGLTSHWMDFPLLESLGQRWPGQVVMVGPIAAEVEARARAIPGIVWAGFVPQPELPPYLRGFDVCIMPHLANELRCRSNPLKICEYLAIGKPFVSVDLPAVQPFCGVIDVAAHRDDFVRLVAANLASSPLPHIVEWRQEIARSFSWDHILGTVLEQLYPLLRVAA